MPLISLHLVCNYHWSTVNWVVNERIRKYLVYPFQGRKHYLAMTLAFALSSLNIMMAKSSASFLFKRKRDYFIIKLCPAFNDTSAKCHTFVHNLHWLSIIHIFLLSSSPFHKIITSGVALNANNWRIHFKIASL